MLGTYKFYPNYFIEFEFQYFAVQKKYLKKINLIKDVKNILHNNNFKRLKKW